MAQGVATAVGVGRSTLHRKWSHLTDSYAAANADALSWVIILTMMLSGLVLTIGGIQADS